MTLEAGSKVLPRAPCTASACIAVAFPALIAYNVPPSATFFNQAAALVGWGAFLLVLSAGLSSRAWPRSRGLAGLLAALAIVMACAASASLWAALPRALGLSSIGTLLAAALVAVVAAALAEAGLGAAAFRAFCLALAVAGVANAAIGIVQVYAPEWTDGNWLAHSVIEGRAVGNLRQPNHLSSLLLWSIVAVVWLGEAGAGRGANPSAGRRSLTALAALLLLFVVVLSGSRTGALGTLTLAAWGLLDRRLSRQARITLVLAPVAYALLWVGAVDWAHYTRQVFGGESRFAANGDISSSRFGIWSNALDLIKTHPWLGVGFGEFNFAWTLTPFPDRPVAFFDHTHNLPLQFAVELGVPLALVVLSLLGWALYRATRTAIDGGRGAGADAAPMQRAALVIVVLVAVHSLLEYPLWYSYFLLPTAFAFGLCLGAAPAHREAPPPIATAFGTHPTRPFVLASMLLVLGGMLALYDYMRVVVIFAPPADAAPLAERIAIGRHSWFFSQHGDYAAATTVDHPSEVMSAFQGAPHYLLDARLMMAWATALDEAGDTDRARYVAARLKEFRNDQSEAFFAACDAAPKPGAKRPFQCEPPTRAYTYLDFR